VTFEDPSGVFPCSNSSTPTGFTLLAGSSKSVHRGGLRGADRRVSVHT
jgi:hypothetical protein